MTRWEKLFENDLTEKQSFYGLTILIILTGIVEGYPI
jgi:hypothetical protein